MGVLNSFLTNWRDQAPKRLENSESRIQCEKLGRGKKKKKQQNQPSHNNLTLKMPVGPCWGLQLLVFMSSSSKIWISQSHWTSLGTPKMQDTPLALREESLFHWSQRTTPVFPSWNGLIFIQVLTNSLNNSFYSFSIFQSILLRKEKSQKKSRSHRQCWTCQFTFSGVAHRNGQQIHSHYISFILPFIFTKGKGN